MADKSAVRHLRLPGSEPRTKLSSWLHLKGAHILGIHVQRFLPWHIERLLLNKRVLDVLRLRRLCKDRAVVYSADTQLRHLCFMILRRRVRRELEIFYVEHGDAVTMILHNLGWISRNM